MPITRVVDVDHGVPPFTFPTWSLRLKLGDHPDAARYLFLGHPDFRRTRPPWRYVEQMGVAHRLEAPGVRLTLVTRPRRRFFTEVRLIVERVPA